MDVGGAGRHVALLVGTMLLLGACGSAGGGLGAAPASPVPTTNPSPSCSPTPALETPSPSQPPTAVRTLPRSIQVSLAQQHLWAYEGRKVIVSTDVTTGSPQLPTPAGHFHILAKYSPYRFVSPWPPGSPYYYDPLWVDYAMVFAPDGFFIHDAWWQRNFGPGGNLKTGSHGCINVPPQAMRPLYQWTRIGDDVIITA